MIMKGYKFRLYPTKDQETVLRQQAGSNRFVWNLYLGKNKELHETTGKFMFYNEMANSLPDLKKEKYHEFLNEVFSQSLQQTLKHLDRAMRDCFKKSKGFPVFKKKSKFNDSFTVPQKFRIMRKRIFIPKVGEVRYVKHRPILGKVKNITVSLDGNQWYVSICSEINKELPVVKYNADNVVGIDLGVKTFATLSDRTKVENPKLTKKHEKKLALLQKRLAKKKHGSNNRLKLKTKIQNLHRRIRDCRNDNLHKVTSRMIAKYDGLVCEDLSVKEMVKDKQYAKGISDCGWSKFTDLLKYKSAWNGRLYREIDRYDPSSQRCSKCGFINKLLTISDRVWTCSSCQAVLDRDDNASDNVKYFGKIDKVPTDSREFKLPEVKEEKVVYVSAVRQTV